MPADGCEGDKVKYRILRSDAQDAIEKHRYAAQGLNWKVIKDNS
jgi:hypothetical protein